MSCVLRRLRSRTSLRCKKSRKHKEGDLKEQQSSIWDCSALEGWMCVWRCGVVACRLRRFSGFSDVLPRHDNHFYQEESVFPFTVRGSGLKAGENERKSEEFCNPKPSAGNHELSPIHCGRVPCICLQSNSISAKTNSASRSLGFGAAGCCGLLRASY